MTRALAGTSGLDGMVLRQRFRIQTWSEDVEGMFPKALVACIAQDRPPHWHELEGMKNKVWREAFRGTEVHRDRAMNVARAALIGDALAA
ncbi:MAG: hypothetical protein ABR588_08850 [Sphingomicrobium sp.]|nr:hypothetical protein [Sphingomonadales bacterium]